MNLKELSVLLADEEKANEFLERSGIVKRFTYCPKCSAQSINFTRGRRCLKCYKCYYEWSRRMGSVLFGKQIPSSTFLLILKLFQLEQSALACARECGVNRNTVAVYYRIIRAHIARQTVNIAPLRGEIESDESYFGGKHKGNRGRGAAGKISVFGMLERNGNVSVTPVPNVKAKTLCGIIKEKADSASTIISDTFMGYWPLFLYGFKHKRINHSKCFAQKGAHTNGIEGFWSYAKQRMLKFHGVSKTHFYSYIKEIEFRYNHRNKNFFACALYAFAI